MAKKTKKITDVLGYYDLVKDLKKIGAFEKESPKKKGKK